MKATIYDIAREAGVSIATVSKVMNDKGKISAARRNQILSIMQRLQYQPSAIASALTGKHTYTLGLLIPDIANPFFAEVARAVEDRGHQFGYCVIICSTDNKDERIERYMTVLKQKQVDGIIIGTGLENHAMLEELRSIIPIVVIGREVTPLDVPTVVADDYRGGRLAAEHLLALGHVRMAVLAESLLISSSRDRLRGFQDAIEDAGYALPDDSIIACGHVLEDSKARVVKLLRGGNRPSGLFCFNDLLAVGALQAAKESNVHVPSELSVVSFDNTILASVTNPPLTSIAQPMNQLGEAAVDLLLRQFEHGDLVHQRVSLRTELIVRQSTDAAHPLKLL
ncbi:LacI family transcriptional regulator [Paenibacillus endophyticus]|uniref:LacI family transcriptional regulator n=1 Tax=Paenibacillus endophyticus TaxID=1294268 RepID=A0A7W5G9L5_9BACL|nr:LacI family DNA-binding transcriptional regulator [Paenibacillus endophyticus]MBB3152304.1 LacI family transcriptional regulator [Paenibacillus endophyticus]